jgi:hypothetical protein
MKEKHMDDPIITTTIVSAQPGWQIAVFYSGDLSESEPFIDYSPIVAWEIERRDEGFYKHGPLKGKRYLLHEAIPIAVSRDHYDPDRIAIRDPDGKYHISGEALDTEERLIKHFVYWDTWRREQKVTDHG